MNVFSDNVKAIDLDSEVLGSDVNVTVSGWGQTTGNFYLCVPTDVL